MRKEILTDEQVENEIERLTHSEAVRIARAEMREKYRRRQYLYQLRNLEKRGLELIGMGLDENDFDEEAIDDDDFDE